MQKLTLSAVWGNRFVLSTACLATFLTAFTPAHTQNAVANGDTRTISLYHTHSQESITATFRVNGSYDYAALEKLNYFLRDWRNNDTIKMDPRLFDVVWETYRESGSREAIHIVSAYRSPATNAMLRRRSSAVAEYSQHMLGKAMDMHYTDVPMSKVREIAIRLQRGGVGYYPTSGSPFVHLDVGSVRAWPRMTYDQLARIFPDGKTVHLAASGQTLGRYDEARNTIQSRNGVSVPTSQQTQSKGFFASLFGGGEEEPASAAPVRGNARTRVASAARPTRGAQPAPTVVAQASTPSEDTPGSFFSADAARRTGGAAIAEPVVALRGRTRPAPAEAAPVLVARAEPPKAEAKPTPLPEPVSARAAPEEFQVRLGASQTPAPQPPRRPADLAAATLVAANVPTPPARPSDLARPAAEDAPVRVARNDLPSVITTGAKAPVGASAANGGALVGALGFAPSAPSLADPAPKPAPRTASVKTAALTPVIAQPIGLRAAILAPRRTIAVATRLDRSNFRMLTTPEETARIAPAALAPVATSLRAAARPGLRDLIFAEPANVATRFEPMATVQQTGFTGPAVRPLPRLETASVATPRG